MFTQGKKWLLDADKRLTLDRIPAQITEINKGTVKPNVYTGTEIVGEIINARNIEDKIYVEILWYDIGHPSPSTNIVLTKKPQFKATDCYVGLFKIVGEYEATK